MNNRTLFFKLSLIGLVASAPLLESCNSLRALFRSRAAEAYSQYQAAVAVGDLRQARLALVTLVRADEDVPDYWIQLGKIELQLGQYAQAYDAFSRAHELDRSNVPVIATLTQLALLGGQIDVADQQARTLAILAPDHPAVALVRSYVALRSGDLDKADAEADKLLADAPSDPNTKILKARILIARKRIDDAISLLEEQHRAQPNDRSAIRALAALYESRGDWRNVVRARFELHKLDPNDANVSRQLVEAALRAGNLGLARSASSPLLSPSARPQLIESTLELWSRYSPAGGILPDAPKLANAVSGDSRVAFANYFNRVGKPAVAAELLGQRSQLPVTTANSRWNAVLAQSMALQGRRGEAKQLFDLVLQREPDQVDALRGRSALQALTGEAKQAIIDAQRLVSVTPRTGGDRLLLAQAYQAAGKPAEVRRTLWQAFQEIPDDERIVFALKRVLIATGDADAERRLSEEFDDQQFSKLTKELV